MKLARTGLFFILLFTSFSANSHNPEKLVISEIERGQLNFENEQIAAEYGAALKRQRIRRLNAMSWFKKIYIFIKAGFEHIIPQGLDHILFVLGLFFSSLKFRSLIIQVTAFTLAHSITLALAAVGVVKLQLSLVEPLIFLSIVWVAIENTIFKQTTKWRPLVIFGFGLLHGLGFAALLTQYGLPKDNFISLLLAFNVGVELGQLAVLIMAFILVSAIFRKSQNKNQLKIPASIIIGLVGLYWFVDSLI
jgi:hypothetical protein|tara:strand:+ start:4309 stop:5055 length:747 start_codon:yes stop_codon:yes gene_type:complete